MMKKSSHDAEIDCDVKLQRSDDEQVDSALSRDLTMIRINVCHGLSHHKLRVPPSFTFGDVKKAVAPKTGLEPKEQRLFFRGQEKEDGERLDVAGVKDKAKILLMENPESKERKFAEMNKNSEMSRAFEAIARVRSEVDKLSARVAALEASVVGGTKVADKEFDILAELLMAQLLKLDCVEADGEAKLQRKAEVRRVQNVVETLDNLKVRNSNPFNDGRNTVSVATNSFGSGVGSFSASNRHRL